MERMAIQLRIVAQVAFSILTLQSALLLVEQKSQWSKGKQHLQELLDPIDTKSFSSGETMIEYLDRYVCTLITCAANFFATTSLCQQLVSISS